MDLGYYENISIFNRLCHKLKISMVNPDSLFELIKKHNAYLSGSFLLQAIMGITYVDYDYGLDFFVFGPENESLENEIINILGKNHDNGKLIFENSKHGFMSNRYKNQKKFNENILSFSSLDIYEICDNLEKIQIFYIDPKIKEMKLFFDQFDFDVCANYFDGNQLYIKNLNNIINKEIIFNPLEGFRCYQDVKSYRNLQITEKSAKRILNYYSREFKIKVNFGLGKIYDFISPICIFNTDFLKMNDSQNIYIYLNSLELLENIINRLTNITERITIHNSKLIKIDITELNLNFPITLKELRLININHKDEALKLPFGCKLVCF